MWEEWREGENGQRVKRNTTGWILNTTISLDSREDVLCPSLHSKWSSMISHFYKVSITMQNFNHVFYMNAFFGYVFITTVLFAYFHFKYFSYLFLYVLQFNFLCSSLLFVAITFFTFCYYFVFISQLLLFCCNHS